MSILRIFWFLVGISSLVSGIIGAFLPILPTVPFLLLAAVGFSKSSTRIHNWLINHSILGPPILDWQKNGAISRKVKLYASLSMLASVGLTVFLAVPIKFVMLQAAILIAVAYFIWTRPEI